MRPERRRRIKARAGVVAGGARARWRRHGRLSLSTSFIIITIIIRFGRLRREAKGEEEEEDEFDRAMMSSEYARLQTIKKERAKQRTRSECEKLDEIADALATIEKEKKELSNARRHLRDMNRAAKARGSDGLGGGIVGVAGSSESSRREGEGAVSSSAEATTTMKIAKKSNLSVNETTS